MTDPESNPAARSWQSWRLLGTLVALAIAAAALAVTTTVFATRNLDAKLALQPEPGLDALHIPVFAMTDQRGETVTESVFDGNLTILEFGFTHCPAACPVMMDQMLRLQDDLIDTPARFVFVSVDPAHDTPKRLAEYAQENGVDPTRWTLLTGAYDDVAAWLTEGLGLSLEQQPQSPINLDDGSTMPNIAHPTHLILVGPDRTILGLTPAFAPDEVDRLAQRVKAASKLWK
ncbi:MAG: SCO family protein [Phycisphaeraceae bacterium]|nr:SCO family protein [Phycisphaeraceae bacterium]